MSTNLPPTVKRISPEEFYLAILRGLISYHERMTMCKQTPYDPYLEALRFALRCMEEHMARDSQSLA